jgi:hypothetical protein
MGRRVTVGILPGGVGQLSIDQNTVSTVDPDASLTLSANGTGTIIVQQSASINGDLTIANQGDLRLSEQTANGVNYVALQAAATMAANYTITLPSAVASATNSVLQSDTSGVTSWAVPKTFTYSTVTTSFNAVAYGGYFVNTTSAGLTATLPSSPAVGDTIRFFDVAKTFDTNTFTVGRNGQLIQGDAADMTVTSESAAFELVYSGATFGWRIFSI